MTQSSLSVKKISIMSLLGLELRNSLTKQNIKQSSISEAPTDTGYLIDALYYIVQLGSSSNPNPEL